MAPKTRSGQPQKKQGLATSARNRRDKAKKATSSKNRDEGLTMKERKILENLQKKLKAAEVQANEERLIDIHRKTADMLEAEVGDVDQSSNKGDEEEDEKPIHKRARRIAEDEIYEELDNEEEDISPVNEVGNSEYEPAERPRSMGNEVWSASSQMRGEVKQKAHLLVISEYGLATDNLPEEICDVVEWLLNNGKVIFIFGDLDVKVRTYDKQKTFSHNIIKFILQVQ
ncbi:hypothetical protein SERLADRAFT_404686 [Serpula lacrymans var. lacrymans S7.9]|uniref:DUF6532 domain-containing protein n=1 Tax=Serpula lacrymans var. lacrymans (strain S7.9) TaxID=578457 RepID=F8NEE0_SERL9|nr:uncharacterized protein SERLADRAFT_404686 [Serpula lacrymans var. lacrymans S7.9]EGO30574.1 hypothetical protein SERLADRAFT_404686 [Serpula lacrymans var. lacrymans S7.9]